MKIQFINNISLDVISGGNIYNKAIIEGLKLNDNTIDYNTSPLKKDYNLCIIDSLCMNDINPNDSALKNQALVALMHQLPELDANTINFYRNNVKFVVTGEPTKHTLINQWQIDKNNITIIRPGVPEYWKPKTVFKGHPKRVIMVSNFIKNKGYEMLIQILKRLNHLHLEFEILGNNTIDKAYAEKIIESIKKTYANVTFHFNLDRQKVYDKLLSSDVFLSVSESESFGMAIFEALVVGLPCLTYKTGDYNYFNYYTNYIGLEHYSENSFSEVLEKWTTHPEHYKSYCNAMSKNNRPWKQVVDEFSIYLNNTIAC